MSNKKILIFSDADNDELVAVLKFLPKNSYFIVVQNYIHTNYQFELDATNNTFSILDIKQNIKLKSNSIKTLWLANYRSIYAQHQNSDPSLASFFSQEYYSLICGIVACLENTDVKIVNHPSTTFDAGDKIRQMIVAKKVGFKLPAQTIANRAPLVLNKKWISNSVFKPIHSSNTLFMNQKRYMAKPIFVNPSILKEIKNNNIEFTLHHFQQKINFIAEYRVIVFNKKVFAFKITGDYSMDWRNHLSNISIEYDKSFKLKKECLAYMKHFKLSLGAFDFMTAKTGTYFIECNPPGHFYFCDQTNKSGMISAFADYLQ
jgi:glutathione synthase/RimK-type ligase-like ATP-grasp enzyme